MKYPAISTFIQCSQLFAFNSIYKIEINGLIGVWRVVSGRRKNILKDRIESYEYSNPQLYLSIIFFTAFLFLLPTILIYYVVFASVSEIELLKQFENLIYTI